MARGNLKKPSRNKGKKSVAPVVAVPPVQRGEGAKGGSFLKWFFILIVALIAIDVFNSFRSGKALFSFKGFEKHFVVQEVIHFTGTDTTGKPMSANAVVVVGPNELAVADTSGCRILIYDFNGKLIRQWGKYGSKGPYELHEPSSIVTDHAGHIFVMDTWNGAIKGYDLNGKSIGTIDLNHFQSFYGPRNITWGGKFFLVSDVANYRVVKLSLGGQIIGAVSGKGTGKGQFMGIGGTILDNNGNWYVADASGNNRVEIFDDSGKVIRIIKVHVPPNALAIDSQNQLFVGCWGAPSKVFTIGGKYLGDLEEASQPGVPLNGILGMDVAPDGLLVTSGGDQVTIYRTIGEKKD
jgi:hypothetical protein